MKIYSVVLKFICRETDKEKLKGHIHAIYMVARNERALNLTMGKRLA
jgi:hypothetical protein